MTQTILYGRGGLSVAVYFKFAMLLCCWWWWC